MPSAKHQALTRLITEGPGVLRAVLAWVDIEVPEQLELRPGPEVVRDGGLYDWIADGTMVAYGTDASGEGEGYVIEVQLAKDSRKPFTWPMYLTILRNRLRRRITLLVVTDDVAIAAWAAQPIDLGPGSVLHPVVIGPPQIPRDVDPALAQEIPATAVLAVVAHGRGPDGERLARRAFDAVVPMLVRGDESAMLHLDVLAAYVDETLLETLLEEVMQGATYEPISELFRRHRDEGRREGRHEGLVEGRHEGLVEGRHEGLVEGRHEGLVEGRHEGLVEALLLVLESRGLAITAPLRDRVRSCTDPAVLDQWLRRAATTSQLHDVFDDDA